MKLDAVRASKECGYPTDDEYEKGRRRFLKRLLATAGALVTAELALAGAALHRAKATRDGAASSPHDLAANGTDHPSGWFGPHEGKKPAGEIPKTVESEEKIRGREKADRVMEAAPHSESPRRARPSARPAGDPFRVKLRRRGRRTAGIPRMPQRRRRLSPSGGR